MHSPIVQPEPSKPQKTGNSKSTLNSVRKENTGNRSEWLRQYSASSGIRKSGNISHLLSNELLPRQPNNSRLGNLYNQKILRSSASDSSICSIHTTNDAFPKPLVRGNQECGTLRNKNYQPRRTPTQTQDDGTRANNSPKQYSGFDPKIWKDEKEYDEELDWERDFARPSIELQLQRDARAARRIRRIDTDTV